MYRAGTELLDGFIRCMSFPTQLPDTEIDWIAYMQEVAGFLGGDWNYENLKG